jgi:hypothetical protein
MRNVRSHGRSLASGLVLVAIGGLGIRGLSIGVLGIGLMGLVGCGGSSVANGGDEVLARRQLSVIATLYGEYLQANNNVPPKDEEAFRSFLNEDSGSRLKFYNVDNLDELLISARDNQPFVIVSGQRRAAKDSPDAPWAAYERTGVEGKRLAAQVRGAMEELTPEQIVSEFPDN